MFDYFKLQIYIKIFDITFNVIVKHRLIVLLSKEFLNFSISKYLNKKSSEYLLISLTLIISRI